MISGLSSSGIATAIRTAGQARTAMDTMTRQIATGQRVSTVRDSGAAWVMANRSRGDAASSRQLGADLHRLGNVVQTAVMTGEARIDVVATMQARAVAATDPGLSASSRAALDVAQKEDNALQGEMSWNQVGSVMALRNTGGTTWGPFSIEADRDDLTWVSSIDGATTAVTAGDALGAPIGTLNDLTSVAAAATAASEASRWRDFLTSRSVVHAALGTRLSREGDSHLARGDRLDRLASALTDTDLGKAAAARATAETRQQLALSTVRQAISTYGNFAGGLLGNVQRTQRGIMA